MVPLQVLAYVEQQPGGPEALKQQLEAMEARWQQYRQDMMAGRPPQQQQQQQASLDAPVPFGASAAAAAGDGLASLPYQQQLEQQQQQLGPGGPVHPDTGGLGFSDDGSLGRGLGFDEDHMFDDPTGLGGLSPVIAPAAARAPAAPAAVQTQGSLGFGMAGGGLGSSASGGLGGRRLQMAPGVGGMQLPHQQQQQRFNAGPSAASVLQQQRPYLQALMTKYNSGSDRGVDRSGSGIPDPAAAPTSHYSYCIQQGDITAAAADPRTHRHQGSMMQTTASVAASGRVQGPGFAQGMVPPGAQTLNPAGGSGSGFGWEGLGQALNPAGSFAVPPGLGSGGLTNLHQQQQQQQFGSRVSVFDRLGPANQDEQQQQQDQRQQEEGRPRSSRHHDDSPPASLRGGGGSSSKRGRSPEASRGLKERDSSKDRGSKKDKKRDSEKEKKEKKEEERDRESSR
jgi:hypothetical protein